jgi:hypothetical protein
MTQDTTNKAEPTPDAGLAEELAALVAKATPGPYDGGTLGLVRAIRGDMAVPLLEARSPFCDPRPAPTVRNDDGSVLFRAGTIDARQSRAFREEHANVELVAWLLNNVPAILTALRPTTPVSEEVVEADNKAGGLWYRRWFKAQVLNNELTAEVATLRDYITASPLPPTAAAPATPSGHAADCEWHCDQNEHECTCGLRHRSKAKWVADELSRLLRERQVEHTPHFLFQHRHTIREALEAFASAAPAIDRDSVVEALEEVEKHFGPFSEITINGQHDPDDVRVIGLVRAALAALKHDNGGQP